MLPPPPIDQGYLDEFLLNSSFEYWNSSFGGGLAPAKFLSNPIGIRKESCNLGLLALKVALLFTYIPFQNTNTVQNQRDILGYWNSSLGGGFA